MQKSRQKMIATVVTREVVAAKLKDKSRRKPPGLV